MLLLYLRDRYNTTMRTLAARIRRLLPDLILYTFIGLLIMGSWWLMVHTFSYAPEHNAMSLAATVWSDFGAHIPLIRSFSLGSNLPPEYPLFPGEPIRYHYLFYLGVGLLERVGVRIDLALNIPSALGMLWLLMMIMLVCRELFHSRWVAILAVLFFLFNGSLAFLQFFENYPLSANTLMDIVNAARFPAFAPWDQRDILAFWNWNIFTNQRHFAAALGMALTVMYLLLYIERTHTRYRYALAAAIGLLTGLLPLFHQPTIVIVAVIYSCYFLLFPRLRLPLIVAGGLSALLILPQLYFQPKGATAIVWYPGFYTHDTFTVFRFLFYWWQNLGLHLLFIPMGFLVVPNRVRKALLPAVVLFVITNLFQFSRELAASHKFLNFSMILGQMLTGYVIILYLDRIRDLKPALLRVLLVGYLGFLMLLLTLSGIIDMFVIINDRHLLLSDLNANLPTRWLADHTPPDAVVLNHTYLYHPASLAGRKIFIGWPYFSWSAGYDTDARWQTQKDIYALTSLPELCAALTRHNLSYVTVDAHVPDQDEPVPSNLIRTDLPAAYEDPTGYRILDRQQLCAGIAVSP